MNPIIFRRSENTNTFGLRGYWVYTPVTRHVHSFAAADDWPVGTALSPVQMRHIELWTFEHRIEATRRSEFENKYIDPAVHNVAASAKRAAP